MARRIGEILSERTRLQPAQLERALRLQGESGERLGALLVKLGLVGERDVASALAEQLGLDVAAAEDYPGAPLGCPPKDQLAMRFSTDGKLLQVVTFPKARDGEEKPGELNWVHCIALDSEGNIYLGDIIGKRLQKFVRRP